MSLPARPNVGLPSTPRRSYTTGPARQDYPPRPRSSASERPPPPSGYGAQAPPLPTQARTLRPQRSLIALPSTPSGRVRSRSLDRRAEPRYAPAQADPPPPLPSFPTSREITRNPLLRAQWARESDDRYATSRSVDRYASRRSEDVMSDSSGASELSMLPASVASSRTSLDDGEVRYEEKEDGKPVAAGHGSSLWASITSVASNLTINVSKALSSNISNYNGEGASGPSRTDNVWTERFTEGEHLIETPVGGESRLTRAMKAYHIQKARNPADLPDWLFDERERGIRSQQAISRPPPAEERAQPPSGPSQPSRPVTTVRREEPQPPARTVRGPTLADRRAAVDTGSEEHVTKSMARLRALRDAKRNAKVRFHGDDDGEGSAEDVRNTPGPALNTTPAPVSREPPTRPMRMQAPLGAATPLGVRGRQPSMRTGLPTGVRPVRA
ncbi:hypothetical protein BN946_scf184799.g77 [Trametes cinnabarina]|uniref:Uncharacterized protein n=1 Tax=Pycnoporus cinnabarinus TaxID=5643 RepID=A0A060S261_PYCCI|nr:hypothetical protein BN946_scf184799.g77 [Trametes cinnabarina]